MYVIKRDGRHENISFDKINRRLQKLCTEANIEFYNSSDNIDNSVFTKMKIDEIAQSVVAHVITGISTQELDEFAAEQCASKMTYDPEYGRLAAHIIVSNHHKCTPSRFSDAIEILYRSGIAIDSYIYKLIMDNRDEYDKIIDDNRDYTYSYFGFKTLERSYLYKVDKRVIERPQYMILRMAIGIHGANMERVKETYELVSMRKFTHASPTLFNASMQNPQLSSCFVLDIEDSIDGIYDKLKECAGISKLAGGIGLNIHKIRTKGSRIKGTNGESDGIIPMIRVFNATARYVNQSGKRKGAFAIYLEPWHADIFDFLELKKNQGAEELRARDLFYGLWVNDLFMERVERKEMWSLMCPDQCPGLVDAYGDKFRELYENYEKAGYYKKRVRAEELWYKIIESQIETGSPYMCYKDTVNNRNNQKNIGTIKSSNLCTEIMLYTAPDETAVCNLASVCLPSYVKYREDGAPYFDHDELHSVTRVIVVNLNNVIDNNYYPSEAARKSNLSHRPIGIGVMGLADVYHMMRIPYDSEMARELNAEIFATMYHAGLERSMELSRERNGWYMRYMQLCNIRYRQPEQQSELTDLQDKLAINEWELKGCDINRMGAYSSFEGSPASRGILQFDMAGKSPSRRYNWSVLKRDIIQHGLRNSMLLAPMPTASTAQIMGFNEAFEAYTSNIYVRQTSAGEFPIVNARLVKDLMQLGLWNNDMRENIIANDGNIDEIENIPGDLRELYKSVWNMQTKSMINMAADRGIYICQSQSLNIFVANPTMAIMHKIHMYGWKMGLKTGMYYLRTLSKAKTQQFTVDPKKSKGNALKSRLLKSEEDMGCVGCSV